ncbi:uncharacterized protein LOC116120404 [Pistacia vera]|uniref:uncharacterized protein LOC116120404 n=1 Tax=Pistacia vera TaxID=55513 RepID=UPI0012636CAE|nr:uncharacterized protein LOC116120404 [Pistacia vera]
MENPVDDRSSKLVTRFTHLEFLQQISIAFGAFHKKLHIMIWNALVLLVPGIKSISETKLMHMQTLKIVRTMCHEGVIWSNKEAKKSLWEPMLTAATLGIYELVYEIMKAYFYSFTFLADNQDDVFRLAILHRHENVFSLVNKRNVLLSWHPDMKQVANMSVKTKNILHLAGKFKPSSQIPGAALQMQRELQWFKAVESCVHPSLQEQRNESNETPRQVFTKEHERLVEKGENG